MTNLSPEAQAVQDAAWTAYDDDALYFFTAEQHAGKIAAAALRAAADQVAPNESHPVESQFWDDESEREWQNNHHVRLQLLDIANELDT